jgi:hypothetical protein
MNSFPEQIDMRSKEGRNYRPKIIAAAVEMREDGYTWNEIANVLPMSARALSIACIGITRNPRKSDILAPLKKARQAERKNNQEYARKCLSEGITPWHPKLDTEGQIDPQLVEEQEREMRYGDKAGKPWELKMEDPYGDKQILRERLCDPIIFTDNRELEELIKKNGLGE